MTPGSVWPSSSSVWFSRNAAVSAFPAIQQGPTRSLRSSNPPGGWVLHWLTAGFRRIVFWVVDGNILDRKISRKRLKVGEDLSDIDGHRLEPVPLNRQTEATLTEIEAGQIADIARQLESQRGTPQDVEWAIQGDELFILQTRPLTTVSPPTAAAIKGRWILFKPTAENFSEPFTPMTVDLLRRVVPPFGLMVQGAFLYQCRPDGTSAALEARRRNPGGSTPHERPATSPPRLDWRRLLLMLSTLSGAYLAGGVLWHRTARVSTDSLAAFESRCEAVLADDELDPLRTLKKLILNDHPFRPIGEFPAQTNFASIRYFLLIDLLRTLLSRFAPHFDDTKLSIICSGGEQMLSQQMVEGIRALADLVRADEHLSSELTAQGANLQSVIWKLDDSHPFSLALSEFLSRFGHRGVRELDLSAPRWREDTTTVLAMVRNYVVREDNTRLDSHGLLLAAIDELHQSIGPRWQRRLVDAVIARIRYYVTLRENTRHYHTMGLATVREKLKRLEHQLIQDGRLRCEDDIFFLEHPEAMALEVGALEWRDVEDRIRERRLRFQQLSQQRPPESFNLQTRIPVLEAASNLLMGDCACPGVATGVARVIRDPSVAAEMAPGDILIAPYTDPAWTPLFPGSGAVIVEVGSYLSHAGTVAREYQIPCLVDVHDCTPENPNGAETSRERHRRLGGDRRMISVLAFLLSLPLAVYSFAGLFLLIDLPDKFRALVLLTVRLFAVALFVYLFPASSRIWIVLGFVVVAVLQFGTGALLRYAINSGRWPTDRIK